MVRSRNPYYDGPISDHFDGLNFYNPNGVPPKGFVELMKWKLGGGRRPWPERFPSPYENVPPKAAAVADMRVSFVGHATVLIQTGGLNIRTGPVWSDRASPVSFSRVPNGRTIRASPLTICRRLTWFCCRTITMTILTCQPCRN